MELIGSITLQDAVLRDQTVGSFSKKNLVAELDGFLHFPSLDQIGMGFKDRVDLFLGRNLLSFEHAPAALIHNPAGKLAVVIDLSSKLGNDNLLDQIDRVLILCLFEHLSGMVEDLLGDFNELAIFPLLLGVLSTKNLIVQ